MMVPEDWNRSNGFFKVSFFRHCPSEDGTQSIEDCILKLIIGYDRITRAEMSKDVVTKWTMSY